MTARIFALLDAAAEAPAHETLLDSAVALGIRAVRHRGPCPDAIAHLLRAVYELACDHADQLCVEPEEVLRVVDDGEAEREYRRAYAEEVGVDVDALHRDLGWYPSELPLLDDGMPVAFLRRVARAEAARDRARCAAVRARARQDG